MRFKEIYGHAAIKDRLIKSTLENRVSHAILLHGPEGSGKYPMALALAQLLHCANKINGDACGECPSCQKAAKMIHPDIHYVFPVATSKKVSADPISDHYIEEWREYIIAEHYPSLQRWLQFLDIENKQGGIFKKEAEELLRKLSLKAFESEFKVVIIWLPEKMNASTANKLLKVIEEPPDRTVFLLVAEQTDTMLPTILSRTQLLRVPKISDSDLSAGLRAQFPDLIDKVDEVVPLADGNFIRGKDLIQTNEQTQFYHDEFVHWLRMAFRFKVQEILDWIPVMVSLGRERQKAFLQYGLHLVRENFLLNQGLNEQVKMTPSEAEFSQRFNVFIHPGNIEALLQTLSLGIRHVEMNANPRILFLDLSAQLYTCLKTKPE